MIIKYMSKSDKIIYDWCQKQLSLGKPTTLVFNNLDHIEWKYKIGKYEEKEKRGKKDQKKKN